jgi:ketosteroid isomerase-like protein
MKALIEAMFSAVDGQQWDRLEGFYHPQCCYERPGFDRLQGVDSVMRFYREERPIQSGVHKVENVFETGDAACCLGSFDGRLRSGASISLRFADHYVFDEGRIARRRTYFYAPLA